MSTIRIEKGNQSFRWLSLVIIYVCVCVLVVVSLHHYLPPLFTSPDVTKSLCTVNSDVTIGEVSPSWHVIVISGRYIKNRVAYTYCVTDEMVKNVTWVTYHHLHKLGAQLHCFCFALYVDGHSISLSRPIATT